MKLNQSCPICQKNLELASETTLGSEKLQIFKCGHAFATTIKTNTYSDLDWKSVDGTKELWDYQKDGVNFILDSNFSCIIGDQMRLGKTPQSLKALFLAIKLGLNKLPCLILVRAANIYQWLREIRTWVSPLPRTVWLIEGTKGWIPPGFDIYLMSMDTFSRRGTCKHCKHAFHDEDCKLCQKKAEKDNTHGTCLIAESAGDAMSDILLNFDPKFKLVIVDEAHSFKNVDSQRSRALTAFLKNIERSTLTNVINFQCPKCLNTWQETVELKLNGNEAIQRSSKSSHCEKCFTQVNVSSAQHIKVERQCGIIPLSGTIIKNRAEEFFVTLNLVAPHIFTSLVSFRRGWCTPDGKRILPYRWEEFKKLIKPFYLRREKEDVYSDVPAINRLFTVIEIEDQKLKNAYNRVLDNIEENMNRTGFSYFSNIGELQQLRQICGIAKMDWVEDYATTFLENTEKGKLAIGVHHHSVRDGLSNKLQPFGVLKLSGEDSPQRKDWVMKNFESDTNQILVINMLAGGVGMDFHYCDNALVVERQWNSADEEQFEFRFYNPNKSIKNRPTTIEYSVAKGTVDEFFYELVEEKRSIFGETIATNWDLKNDTSSFRQLMERTVASRL